MSRWIAAQIAASRHEYVQHHVRRIGLTSFYPVWRRTYGRPPRTEVGHTYAGYLFVLYPPSIYALLDCCSAIYGIVARASDGVPLTSTGLDAHVEDLMGRRDRDGFVPAPRDRQRTRFLRGDRVFVETRWLEGAGTLIRLRSGGGAEVQVDGAAIPVTVPEADIRFAY